MYETRLSRVFALYGGLLALLAVRAFTLQVVTRDEVLDDHRKRVRGRIVVAPRRGEILWDDRTPIVSNEPGFSVEIDFKSFYANRWSCGDCAAVMQPKQEPVACAECGSDRALARATRPDALLADLLGLGREEYEAALLGADAKQAKHPDYRYHEFFRDVDRDTATRIALAADRLPGIIVRARSRRTPVDAASEVVGTTREPYPEDVLELSDPERKERGERVYSIAEIYPLRFGARGLEKAFDDELRGAPGISRRTPRDKDGRARDPAVEIPVVDGVVLHTTLSRDVQVLAEEIVAAAPGNAAAVVLDVTSGAVVAIASKSKDGLNHAVCSILPGSVFKLATSVALLESGISPDDEVECRGKGVLPSGREYKCDAAHGAMPFVDAFARSCNAYFATMAERAGPEAMRRACSELGLDVNPTLRLAGTPCGLEYSGQGGRWYRADMAKIGIGMGKALVSPVQIAMAYARIASGGRRIAPFLLRDEAPSAPEADPSLARFALLIRDAARRVVTEGTGRRVTELGDVEAAGKSGTGDVNTRGTEHNAWFVAFAPASAPRFVAVVVYEKVAGHGAETAGRPVARLLAEALR